MSFLKYESVKKLFIMETNIFKINFNLWHFNKKKYSLRTVSNYISIKAQLQSYRFMNDVKYKNIL